MRRRVPKYGDRVKRALRLWTLGGLAVDLVVINTEPASYLSPVQHEIGRAHF